MLELNNNHNQQQSRLLYPPYQYFFHHSQISKNKEKILSSLQQMGVDVEKLHDKPMGEIIKQAEVALKKSYTVKVVAVKDGEIGVLSRRVEMKNRALKRADEQFFYKISYNRCGTKTIDGQAYVINNYFYPKILKAIKKQIDPKDDEQKQKLLRWQAEQYERLKGRPTDTLLPDLDEEHEDPKVQSNKLIIAGLGSLKQRSKILPQVKRFQMGQTRSISNQFEIVKNDNKTEYNVLVNQEVKKLSYSRLLADLTERDLINPLQKLMIDNTNSFAVPVKSGGVIYELEEENEHSPPINKQKLPNIMKTAIKTDLPKSDSDNFQKRLKKFQDKFLQSDDKK